MSPAFTINQRPSQAQITCTVITRLAVGGCVVGMPVGSRSPDAP